jgi:quinol monooxygenase YgiN
MKSSSLTVVARFRAQPGKEQQLRLELRKLLAPTHAEDGCINYDLHESIDDPALFLFHENWTSREALDRHLATPHLTNFLGQVDRLLAEPIDLSFWKQLG